MTGGFMTEDAQPPHDDNADLVKQIKASAKEIWLAGLGAFSQKEDQAAATTTGLYQQLVKEGRDIERVTREQLDRNIQNVKTIASDGVDQVKEKAVGSFSRLETIFGERVSKAMHRLGLATNHDFQGIDGRLSSIESRIADLEGMIQDLKKDQSKFSKSSKAAKKS